MESHPFYGQLSQFLNLISFHINQKFFSNISVSAPSTFTISLFFSHTYRVFLASVTSSISFLLASSWSRVNLLGILSYKVLPDTKLWSPSLSITTMFFSYFFPNNASCHFS